MKRITQIYILIFLHPYIIRVNTQNKQPICDIYSCKGTENENEESDYNHRVKYNVPTYCSQRTKIRTPNSTSTPFNYTLTPCNNNSQCIISLTTDRSTCTEEPAPPNSKYPGERCTSSLSCIWGTCTDHICISGNIYTPCTADVECNVGLYCHNNTGTCMGWKLVNQYCDIYTKCASYLICDLNLCCVVGGKNVGEIAYSPLACATLYTSPVDAAYTYTYIVGGYGHITYYCADGPYLIGYNATVPLPCPYSGLCEYNLTMGARSTVVYRDCQCGITQKGESYCPLGMGDMAQEINDTEPMCHISYPMKGLCNSPISTNKRMYTPDEEMKYWKAYIGRSRIYGWSQYIDNPECAKNMINSEYFYALNKVHNDTPTPPDPPHNYASRLGENSILRVFVLFVIFLFMVY